MKNKILFVVSLLFALMYLNAGFNMFLHYMPMPTDMTESQMKFMAALGDVTWLMPLVGIVQIISSVLCITGKTRALGAIMIFPISIGVLLTHLINMPGGTIMSIVLLLINLWMIYENRAKYMPMIQK